MRKVLVYNGGAVALEPFPDGSDGGGANYAHQILPKFLDHAGIIVWPSNLLELVPAPGSNLVIIPIWVTFRMDTTAGAYTGLSAGRFVGVVWSASAGDPACAIASFFPTDGTSDNLVTMSGGPAVSSAPTGFTNGAVMTSSDMIGSGLSLRLFNDTDLSDGHADNTLRVWGEYRVLNVDTGALVAA